MMSLYDNPQVVYTFDRPLDENFYNPTEDSASFFKTLTQIPDEEELKRHVIAVQSEAYKVCSTVLYLLLFEGITYLAAGLPLHDHTKIPFYEVEGLLRNGDHSIIELVD
jgi:hypothetical protein